MASDLRIGYSEIPLNCATFNSSYPFAEDTTLHNSIAGEKYTKAALNSAINGTVQIEYDTGKNITKTADFFAMARADLLPNFGIAGVSLKGSNYPYSTISNISSLSLWLRSNQEVDYSSSDNTLTAWRAWNNSAYSFTQATSVNKPKKTWADNKANWLRYSEQFDNAAWSSSNASVTPNTTANPRNLAITADTLTENALVGVHGTIPVAIQNIAVGVQYRLSINAHLGSGTRNLGLFFGTSFNSFGIFDLVGGTVVSTSNLDSFSITSLGGGWYNCTIIDTATSSGANLPIYGLMNGTTLSYLGDGTSSIILDAASFQEAALSSSYIPTTSAEIYAGINNLSAIKFHDTDSIAMPATTLYGNDFTVIAAVRLWAGNDGTTNYTIFDNEVVNLSGMLIRIEGSPGPNFKVTVRTNQLAANTFIQSSQIIQQGVTHVISVVKSGGTGTIYVDGVNVGSGALSNPVTPTNPVSISNTAQPFKGEIADIAVFNSGLSNTDRQNVEGFMTAEWKTTPVYSNMSIASSLIGTSSQDLYSSFATSSAYRYWWLELPVSFGTTSKGTFSKAFFGSIFDFNASLADYTIEKIQEDSQFYASTAETKQARSNSPHYKIKFIWDNVSDDKARDFSNFIIPQIQQSGFFLSTTTYNDPLDNQQLIYCKIIADPVIEQNNSKSDINIITLTFEEMTG